MLIWRGYGILVVLFTIVGYAIGQIATEKILGSPLPEYYRGGSELFSMLLAAGIVYGLHLVIESKNKSRVFIDKETGQEVEFKRKHDLFFIPLRFWPFILALLGVLFYFQK